jgi:hypothetical protein
LPWPEQKGRIKFKGAAGQQDRLGKALLGPFVLLRQCAQVEVVGVEVLGRLAAGPVGFAEAHSWLNGADDARCDLILQFEDIVEAAVEAVGAQERAGRGVDQLSGDADAGAGLPDRAFEYVAHPQLARHLLHINRLALVGEGGIAGDHE